MAESHIVTIRIEPMGGSKKQVGLESFIAELQAVHGTLVRADKITSRGHQTTKYEVVGLSLNSPAQVVIASKPIDRKIDSRAEVLTEWIKGLATIREGKAPPSFDRPMLEKVSELAAGARKKRVRTTLAYGNTSVEINHIFERRIVHILDRTEKLFSSVEGKLEAVNLHNRQNLFAVYPQAGAKKVVCHFAEAHRDKVKQSIDKNVIVTGMAEYKYRDRFPHRIEVRDIDVLSSEDWVSIYDLRGIAPDATGDTDSVEFVRQIRDGWQ